MHDAGMKTKSILGLLGLATVTAALSASITTATHPSDPLPPGDDPGQASWCFLPTEGFTNCYAALAVSTTIGCHTISSAAGREECFGTVRAMYETGHIDLDLLIEAGTCTPGDPACEDALEECKAGDGEAAECGLHLNDSVGSCMNDAGQEVEHDTGFMSNACGRMFCAYSDWP